ncbi:hypothetical protein NDU88_007901 [Pleurodeles waltl]|uniref:Uncharacterized protein n=1 Tax=Pleurodeles waltl TaxID=8319 RepID=A0AAV7STT4_PLEWA|nr:hypothetical protein NDU88_007901 [Pleurodeles waltl]
MVGQWWAAEEGWTVVGDWNRLVVRQLKVGQWNGSWRILDSGGRAGEGWTGVDYLEKVATVVQQLEKVGQWCSSWRRMHSGTAAGEGWTMVQQLRKVGQWCGSWRVLDSCAPAGEGWTVVQQLEKVGQRCCSWRRLCSGATLEKLDVVQQLEKV